MGFPLYSPQGEPMGFSLYFLYSPQEEPMGFSFYSLYTPQGEPMGFSLYSLYSPQREPMGFSLYSPQGEPMGFSLYSILPQGEPMGLSLCTATLSSLPRENNIGSPYGSACPHFGAVIRSLFRDSQCFFAYCHEVCLCSNLCLPRQFIQLHFFSQYSSKHTLTCVVRSESLLESNLPADCAQAT